MIERRAQFIRELDSLCENIVNCGELNYDEEKWKNDFFTNRVLLREILNVLKI